MRFLAILLSLHHTFSLKLHIIIDSDNVYHLAEVKPTKENLGQKG